MSDSVFEEEIITLARLITKSSPLKKRERDEEDQSEKSEEYPGAFNSDWLASIVERKKTELRETCERDREGGG